MSVKSLIKTIEGQSSLGSSTGSSRRGSSDSLGSPTSATIGFSNHIDTTRASPERRINNNNENIQPLRSALKKPKDIEDKTRSRSMMYEKTNSPVIESLRPVSSENSVSSLLSIRRYQSPPPHHNSSILMISLSYSIQNHNDSSFSRGIYSIFLLVKLPICTVMSCS